MTSSAPVSSAKRRLRSLGLLVAMGLIAALLCVGSGVSSAFADGGTASIAGTVTNSATSEGLAGVTVQINSQDFSYFDATVTAPDGTYTLSTVPAGSYTLSFQAADGSNFVQQCWQNDNCHDGNPTYFTVGDGQSLTGFDVALVPGATLTGTVDGADAPGTGLADVSVVAQSATGAGGNTETDASGNYSIAGLAAGDYTVEFQPNTGNYLSQWWNNQPTDATADTVSVSAAATVTGIDAQLALGATISGTVSTASGPLAGASVYADGANSEVGSATTDSDGNYTISALIPDVYTVTFQAPQGQNLATQYWHSASTLAAATPISVSSSAPATGIDATLSPGASISGTIFAPGTPKVGLAHVLVGVYPAAGGGGVTYAETDTSGRYDLVGLPAGSYVLSFNPEQGVNAAAEWSGGSFTQSSAEHLILTTGETLTRINQQLIVGSAISGTVISGGASPTPLANVDVTIWASDQVQGNSDIPPFETFTDASGNYSFPNIGPGRYTIYFASDDANYASQWWKNKPTQAKASRLVVKKNVNVSGVGATLAPVVITPGTPTISGKARVGLTLTAHPGNWKPKSIVFSYQWLRSGTAIAGATSATYVPTSADIGHALTVAVTGTTTQVGSQGLSQSVTSAATAPVRAAAG